MKKVIILITLILAGCSVTVKPEHWDGCVKVCETKPPLVQLEANSVRIGDVRCLCADGNWYDL